MPRASQKQKQQHALNVSFGLLAVCAAIVLLIFVSRRYFFLQVFTPIFSGFSAAQLADLSRAEIREAISQSLGYEILVIVYYLMQAALLACISFFMYRVWDALPPYRTHLSAAKSGGLLLFFPFTLYWMFISLVGFARCANAVLRRRRLTTDFVNVDISLWLCVGFLGSFVPYYGIGQLMTWVWIVFSAIYFWQAYNAASVIIRTNRSSVERREPLAVRNVPIVTQERRHNA